MTEREAEAFGERLTRIWVLESDEREEVEWSSHLGRFLFSAKIACAVHDIYFDCRKNPYLDSMLGCQFFLMRKSGKRCTGRIVCFSEDGEVRSAPTPQEAEFTESFKHFAEEWLPFFRRGCWLSGCDIEASAHEKAEWMQGFTKEEIEAWNLKM